MSKRYIPAIAALALAGALSATAAHAGEVNWSIGINLPPVATVISNGPAFYPPVAVMPAPRVVVAQPAPRVIYEPAPVYYDPPPRVVVAPPVRVVQVVEAPRWHRHGRWVRDGRGWREVDWRERDTQREGQRYEHRGQWRAEAPREMLPPQRPDWR